ncbi:MAG TPA: L,D-transpeptidase [Hyphomicrobiaceae bacterium]|nr:L,D-transpeptidase [Hyphomicrobiaceae bacterium]
MPSICNKTSNVVAASLGLAGLVALSPALGVAVTVLSPTEAAAQGMFGFWEPAYPRTIKRPRSTRSAVGRPTKEEKAAEAAPERNPAGPLVLVVSIKSQRVTVHDATGPIAEAPISSGRVGYPTPTGVFTVLEKNKVHFSNLYGNAPMPNMQRITWSGVALHSGPLPGYAASHGCIRLPHGFSKKLFDMTKLGTRVIVTRDPVVPAPISHERLFAALPPENEPPTAAVKGGTGHKIGAQVADASDSTAPGPLSGSSVLDMTAAAAEMSPAATDEPMKRSFRERWKGEMARLHGAVITAGYNKAEAASLVTRSAKAAEAARGAAKQAKAEADRLAQAARKALDAKEAGTREFLSFAKKLTSSTDMSDEALKKAAETEEALEGKVFDLGDAVEAARAEAALAADAASAAEAKAQRGETKRRSAVNDLAKANTDLAAAIAASEAAKRRDAKRPLPVSVFISRATQRLYVRQGYEPIFDAPVTVASPDQPIGTHVFTALEFKDGKTGVSWNVASIPYAAAAAKAESTKSRSRKDAVGEANPPADTRRQQTAAAALERITIPEEVRDQIVDVMKPGSSLVISDHPISKETGKYTDFIVLTR